VKEFQVVVPIGQNQKPDKEIDGVFFLLVKGISTMTNSRLGEEM